LALRVDPAVDGGHRESSSSLKLTTPLRPVITTTTITIAQHSARQY
jgi:hypothetical protein